MTLPSRRRPEPVARHPDDEAAAAAEPVVFGPTGVDAAALPPLASHQLEVTTSVSGPSATVHVRGELLQETVARLNDAASPLADDAGVEHLVVDLSGVTFMDSTGLGSLLSLRNHVLVRGGRFALVRPEDRVFRLFEITQLDSVFAFVDAR